MLETARDAGDKSHRIKVIVAGYYATGDGYPNGAVTQRILSREACVVDAGLAMPADQHLWRAAKGHLAKRLLMALRLFGHNFASFCRVLSKCDRDRDLIYVRYPALPFMLLIAMVPARLRPRCYVDGFISLWETMFLDRTAGGGTLFGRIVHGLEGRALRAAHRVLVDTLANAEFMRTQFALDSGQTVALPLGVDEERWRNLSDAPTRTAPFVVVFVGTFVPLHGFGVIASAVDLFDANDAVRFVFVGDGQDARVLERLIERRPDLDIVWRRGWHAPEELARIVADADACLGVFGGEGKAARVLPYKLYLYLLLGRPVITQSSLSAPAEEPPPVLGTLPSAADVAAAIRRLRDDPSLQARLASEGRAYYARHLSNAALASGWRELLARHASSAATNFKDEPDLIH